MIDIIKYLNNRVESLENNLRSAENALTEKDHQIEVLSQFIVNKTKNQFSIYKQKIVSLELQNKQLKEQLDNIKEILKS